MVYSAPMGGDDSAMENHKMKNELLIQIGRRLSESRTEKGVTQEQLANMTGLSIKMISAAENGHKAMRPENIVKICDSLSISTDYLLRGETPLLTVMAGQKKVSTLTSRQREALSKIIEDFLSAFDENSPI